jgi:ABC-type transport system involved in multi-copper enzyme maturation permease subunit
VSAATRALDRVRFWRSHPNPLWIRELRQSARLTRTPVILTVLAILMTLLIASVGGVVASEGSPATTGQVIFQVFFSLAYFVVALVGPAVAANAIAAEREGHTWEAVLLTGLSPVTIARGKFLAAFTSIAMYVVMLAPVGALTFLFGGVTAVEVIVAFAVLFLLAVLGVAFGLAVSSKMASVRAALLVTLLLAFPLSVAAFGWLGIALSQAAHYTWPGVPEGPIWLPAAYERAPFGADYVFLLIVLPLLAIALPAWFLYEVTVANLTGAGDDRSSGVKRWFVFATPALTFALTAPVANAAAAGSVNNAAMFAGMVVLFSFLVGCAFLFADDPVGPSRRVALCWQRRRANAFVRLVGPGVMRSAVLLLGVGMTCLGAFTQIAFAVTGGGVDGQRILALGAYVIAFFVFVVGLGAWLRARAEAPIVARLLLFAVLFGVVVGPWVIAAIGGILRDNFDRDALVIAAPSPFYVLLMFDTSSPNAALFVRAGLAAIVGWAVLGLLFLGAARRRCSLVIRRHETMLAEGDRLLAAEDAEGRGAQ